MTNEILLRLVSLLRSLLWVGGPIELIFSVREVPWSAITSVSFMFATLCRLLWFQDEKNQVLTTFGWLEVVRMM